LPLTGQVESAVIVVHERTLEASDTRRIRQLKRRETVDNPLELECGLRVVPEPFIIDYIDAQEIAITLVLHQKWVW